MNIFSPSKLPLGKRTASTCLKPWVHGKPELLQVSGRGPICAYFNLVTELKLLFWSTDPGLVDTQISVGIFGVVS